MVHCSEYVRRSFASRPFFREYRHEVAISAGLMEVGGRGVRGHEPRRITPNDSVRVGMVARLDPIKNHRLVLDAFPLLLCRHPNTTLEFIGDGAEMERLKAHARELGIADRVVFHGRLPSPFPVMREWDLFLYATTEAEGFGAALAEALALGLPSVVTDVGPMREVGGEDGAVRYVPPDSPAELAGVAAVLIADHRMRLELSTRARARAEANFDGAVFARRIAQLLGARAPSRLGSTAGARVA
jgi:glycosyltransferase involved in cell wall biosynthesis